ncbi:unnamed protein product, partial [Phaeothamnion confervicola]
EKTYTAVVFGHPEWDATEVETGIGADPTHRFRMAVYPLGRDGAKVSRTTMRVLRRGRCGLKGPHWGCPIAQLELRPHTGRRHQLRLHCLHVGHPILGDYTYAEDVVTYRNFLHAARLVLP